MKTLVFIILIFSCITSVAQKGKADKDSILNKQKADSISNNQPLLSKADVFEFIQEVITGYRDNRGQLIQGKFADAILVEDAFNGQQCNIILDYAIKVIASDLTKLLNEAEKRKKK